MLAATVAQRL
jgi:hypothetical protein